MPRKRASRSGLRTAGMFARKLTVEMLEDRRLLAVDFSLLKDINAVGASSSPANFVDVGSIVYFTANDGTSGFELWKSNGTDAGTVLVKDVRPGSQPTNSSDGPRNLTNVGGTLYFTVNDGTSGIELWKSDGTEVGTVRVKDVRAGLSGSAPRYLTNVGGTLYFVANDGTTGYELWKSDGTEAGTVLVKDFNGSSFGSGVRYVIEANGRLYAVASTSQYGSEIWVADLTTDPLAGEYNLNGKVDAADYVLWRKTLGSTTNLRANGNTVGISAGIIDQSDYNVWRSNFGNPVPVADPGVGSGSALLALAGSGLVVGETSAEEIRVGDLGLGIAEDVGQIAMVIGDSPSPRPSPRGRGSIEVAAFDAESDLLLLLSLGSANERLPMANDVAAATYYESPASAGGDELMALDVAFAGVGQSGIEGVRRW